SRNSITPLPYETAGGTGRVRHRRRRRHRPRDRREVRRRGRAGRPAASRSTTGPSGFASTPCLPATIASIHATLTLAGTFPYAAAKSGLLGLRRDGGTRPPAAHERAGRR